MRSPNVDSSVALIVSLISVLTVIASECKYFSVC